MPVYRIGCELIVEGQEARHATDRLRDALCEIDAELDCVTLLELSEEPVTMGFRQMRARGLSDALRELSPDVSAEEEVG